MNWIRSSWSRLVAWLDGSSHPQNAQTKYKVEYVSEEPDQLSHGILYAVGESGHLWYVTFQCPCECGGVINLNLLPDDSPVWIFRDAPGGATIEPSIWRTTGCRSHFFLQGGRVLWCKKVRR